MHKGWKNFIKLWSTQSLSQWGSMMTSFALGVWAYKKTGSTMTMSLINLSWYVPFICISFMAGSLIDCVKKKKLIVLADTAIAISTLIIGLLFYFSKVTIWMIVINNFINGFFSAIQAPANAVVLGLLVDKEDLEKASGLQSFSENLSVICAPIMGAFLMRSFGMESVIIIDLITFLIASINIIFFIEIKKERLKKFYKLIDFEYLREGFIYIKREKILLLLILSFTVMNLFSKMTYENILQPLILAKSGGNEQILSFVLAILGLGGVFSSLFVTKVRMPRNKFAIIYGCAGFSFLFGDLAMAFSKSPMGWSIAAFMASFPMPFIHAASNYIFYTTVPVHKQGRVFSAKNGMQRIAIPLGLFLGGFITEYIFQPLLQNNKWEILHFTNDNKANSMSLLFICTGIAGFLSAVYMYRKVRNITLREIKNKNRG